jgi:uncharacterized protein (TIGR03437 family)
VLVAAVYNNAVALAGQPTNTEAQIGSLRTGIEQAYTAFLAERQRLTDIDQIDNALRAALYFTRASEALAPSGVYPLGVQRRLQITVSRLEQARNLLPGSGASGNNFAHAPSASTIGAVVALSSASFAPVLASGSMGTLFGSPDQSPFALTNAAASQLTDTALPYELAGASVTIGGRAAALLYVSPARVSFCVPAGLPNGEAELLVTSRDGYVSRGTIIIAPLAPGLFTAGDSGTGVGLVLNAATNQPGPFAVLTPETLGSDKRTRLLIFATGLSVGAANVDPSNDVQLDGSVLPNVAESVTVEARLSDGRRFLLPVEYAGARRPFFGLDQINVVLRSELAGAGSVELTVIADNQRSNSVTVSIR